MLRCGGGIGMCVCVCVSMEAVAVAVCVRVVCVCVRAFDDALTSETWEDVMSLKSLLFFFGVKNTVAASPKYAPKV